MSASRAREGRADLQDLSRVLGVYPPPERERPGPMLVLVGGLHGNEPSGVRAIRTVLSELDRRALPIRGKVVGIAGNTKALALGERFLSNDLNRMWDAEGLRDLGQAEAGDSERAEQREILELIQELLAGRRQRVVLLDLHSTSAEGSPFAIMADTLQNRPIAQALGVPILLGLEELVAGTLLSWFSECGHTAICLEGGKNDLPSTEDHHVAAVWLTLVSAGLVRRRDAVDHDRHQRLLREACELLPEFCELRFRFEVPEGAVFEMERGYTNFHIVREGEPLARINESGEEKSVPCLEDGLLLMPRYQGQGADGFFLGREVPPGRLRLSQVLRRLRLEWLLPLLRGVTRDAAGPRRLLVQGDRLTPRKLEWLRLFGYRRSGPAQPSQLFLRRPEGREAARP